MTAPDRRSNATGGPFAQDGSSRRDSGQVRGYGMGNGAAPAAAPGPRPQQAYVHLPGYAPVGGAAPAGYAGGPSAAQMPAAGMPMQGGYAAGMPSAAAYVRPATSIPQQPERPKKRRAGFWIALIVLLLALVLAAVLAFTMLDGGKAKRQGSLGQLEGKSAAEIQAEIDRVVDEGMFNISIASVVELADGASPAELRIENVPGNRYLMKVVITRDDTGEQLYETDLIEPNHHIQSDVLDVALPAGTYDCTATFSAYQPDTEELAGQAAAKIAVQVQG